MTLDTDPNKDIDEFIEALMKKSAQATQDGQHDIAKALHTIIKDIRTWQSAYEQKKITYERAYSEISSMYLFAEAQLKLDGTSLSDYSKHQTTE